MTEIFRLIKSYSAHSTKEGDPTAEQKKYYWLKMRYDFFTSKRIKKLRRMAGGDTYTIIYLKMQLLSLKTDGILTYTGLEDNFPAELALDLDEKEEDVRVVLMYLASCDLIETSDNVNFFLPYVAENTGSETGAAERMRKMRERNNVTPLLHGRYTEKEIENRDREKSKEIESVAKKPTQTRFTPPTVEEVQAYCSEKGYNIDAERFVDYYTSNGWKVGRNPMKDWKASIRTWVKKDNEPKKLKSGFGTEEERRAAHKFQPSF